MLDKIIELWSGKYSGDSTQLTLIAENGETAIITPFSEGMLNVSSGCMSTALRMSELEVKAHYSECLGHSVSLWDNNTSIRIWREDK